MYYKITVLRPFSGQIRPFLKILDYVKLIVYGIIAFDWIPEEGV